MRYVVNGDMINIERLLRYMSLVRARSARLRLGLKDFKYRRAAVESWANHIMGNEGPKV
jgi:hypothetical protein